jgi:hypothetical protein
MGLTGFEPVTSRLSAGCSNHAKLQPLFPEILEMEAP